MYKVQKEIELDAAVRNALNSNEIRISDESTIRNQLANFIENDSIIAVELNKLKSDLKESEQLIRQTQSVENAIKAELEHVRNENQKNEA